MISVCIPIYNFDVSNLVGTLSNQLSHLDVPSEIILIDDGSEPLFKKSNESVCSSEIYIQLEKNIGRSAIRNRFLDYAKYDHLLFLDCDVVIPSDDFMINYIKAIKENAFKVICGGRKYQNTPPKSSFRLRWKYGLKRESKTSEERNLNPNKSFMSTNFLINKDTFKTIRFDERLVKYGHEDTLFGFNLKKRNITIFHIDNPILNAELVSNSEYISKNEEAILNLIRILKFTEYDKGLIKDIALLNFYYKWYNLRKLISVLFLMLRLPIRYILSKGYDNLYILDFYKLGYLSVKLKTT